MATYTPRYNLKKPAGSENMLISDINGNMDKIEEAIWGGFQIRGDLTSANDLNNLTGDGVWRIGSTVPGHAPTDTFNWAMVVQVVYGSVTQQWAFKPTAKAMYIREYTGSPQVWGAWEMVAGYTGITRISYGSSSYVEYWRSGQTVCVKMFYNVTDGTVAAWTTKQIATLPEGFRPAQAITMRGVVDRAGDEGTSFVIESSGAVKVNTRFNSFSTGGDVLQGTITYPARY